MTQLVLNIEQPAVLPRLKDMLKTFEGVSIVSTLRRARKACVKKADPTLMTKDEFYAMIDEAKEQARSGQVGPTFSSAKELIEYLKAQ